MFPQQLMNDLRQILTAKRPIPCFIWGAPGIGKSQIVCQVAKELGFEVRTLVASTCDPVDLRGCLAIDGEFSVWKPPKFFQKPEDGHKVLYFFDELNTATPAVQTAFFRIILEGKLDNIDISDCPRIGAGNRATDMACAQRMPTPLVSRFYHATLEVSVEDWKKWAYEHEIKTEVISFLNFRPALLLNMPKERDTPFPTPRTWEFASRLIDQMGMMSIDQLAGAIGQGAAGEFYGFLKIWKDLPSSPEEVLEKKIKSKEPDKQYAINGILTNHFRTHANKEVMDKVLKYSYDIQQEFAVSLVKDCIIVNKKEVMQCKEFIKWGSKFQGLIV